MRLLWVCIGPVKVNVTNRNLKQINLSMNSVSCSLLLLLFFLSVDALWKKISPPDCNWPLWKKKKGKRHRTLLFSWNCPFYFSVTVGINPSSLLFLLIYPWNCGVSFFTYITFSHFVMWPFCVSFSVWLCCYYSCPWWFDLVPFLPLLLYFESSKHYWIASWSLTIYTSHCLRVRIICICVLNTASLRSA